MRDESRLRSLLEIATAVLLGLVSVATAAGAYQASEWSRQAGEYTSAANQLRDESLAANIATQVSSFDDNDRVLDVLAIEFDIMAGAPNVDELHAQQQVLLEGGSPGLAAEWQRWIDSGYSQDAPPLSGQEFAAATFAPTFGPNSASSVAYGLAEELSGRSLLVTVASAIFALALLLLGVSGANRSLTVAMALALGGAGAFVAGVVISTLAIVG